MSRTIGYLAVLATVAAGFAASVWSVLLPQRVSICDVLADPMPFNGRRIEVIGIFAPDVHGTGVSGFCDVLRADAIWFREPFEMPKGISWGIQFSERGMSYPKWLVTGTIDVLKIPPLYGHGEPYFSVVMDRVKISAWWWLNFNARTKRVSEARKADYRWEASPSKPM